jgi:hypothetical protein
MLPPFASQSGDFADFVTALQSAGALILGEQRMVAHPGCGVEAVEGKRCWPHAADLGNVAGTINDSKAPSSSVQT